MVSVITKLRGIYERTETLLSKLFFSLPIPAALVFLLRGNLNPFLASAKWGMRNNLRSIAVGNIRRNIHRIEKGLSHLEQRPVFALGYIGETIELFEAFSRSRNATAHISTLAWARSILTTYFDAVDPSALIMQLHRRFEKACAGLDGVVSPESELGSTPYGIQERPPLTVTYENMRSLALRRRSVRLFDGQVVSEEVLKKAVSIAGLSPSACNRQPFLFHCFTDADTIARLSRIPGGMNDFDMRESIPCIAVLTVDYSNYFHERDLVAPIMDAGMAAMALQFALESLGLSSVCVNWPLLSGRYRKIRKVISFGKGETPVLFLAIGYPSNEAIVPSSCKKEPTDLMTFNEGIHT